MLDSGKHALSNHHRAVFSTTSFPFNDPSAYAESPNLLGIRIDVCSRLGTYVAPYYVLLKRVGKDKKSLRVHRHTIPIFVPLSQLERKYLPVSDTSSDSQNGLKRTKTQKQDLKRLVRELRKELVSWHLRRDAVTWFQDELGLIQGDEDGEPQAEASPQITRRQQVQKLGITSVDATSPETRYIRLEWDDGRVGRIKLSNRGLVERAIVIGDDGRDKPMENCLVGGDGRIESIVHRLLNAQGMT